MMYYDFCNKNTDLTTLANILLPEDKSLLRFKTRVRGYHLLSSEYASILSVDH